MNTNNETFGWREACKYLGEGKRVDRQNALPAPSDVWDEVKDGGASIQTGPSWIYRLRPEPRKPLEVTLNVVRHLDGRETVLVDDSLTYPRPPGFRRALFREVIEEEEQ
jgi:hypothetical protein